jgi:hypothetical protein
MKTKVLLALAVALTVLNSGLSPLSNRAQAVNVLTGTQEDARMKEGRELKKRLVEIEGRLKSSDPEVKRRAEEDYRQVGLDYIVWARKHSLPVKRETVRGPSRNGKAGAGGMMARPACPASKRSSDGVLFCSLVSSDVDSFGRMHCTYDCIYIEPKPTTDTKR